jgi:hypothetical protein
MTAKHLEYRTVTLPADTEADLKAVETLTAALRRQIGWEPKFELWKDEKGKICAVAGWNMTREERAAIEMFQRRGCQPKDDKGKPTASLLAAKDVEKKKLSEAMADKKMTKNAPDEKVLETYLNSRYGITFS